MTGFPKNSKSGPHCWGWEVSTQFSQQFVSVVTGPPLVGCVVWSLEALILPSIKFFFSPAKDQHGFRLKTLDYICPPPAHNWHRDRFQPSETTSPYSVCGHRLDSCLWYRVSWYTDVQDFRIVPAARDHSMPVLLPKWETSFRGIKSSMRIIRTSVPQGSKLAPSLFNYYIADMPRPTPPVKRVCYADDITVWASWIKIPQLESMINRYLREVGIYLNKTHFWSLHWGQHSSPRTHTSSDVSKYYSWRYTTTTRV